MKAEELRIGNWVNLYDDYNSQVTGLTNTKKVWCVDDPTDKECAWSTDKIKPIPLTEEWLLKFGFEFDGMFYQFNKHQIRLIGEEVPYWIDSSYITNIKHVHQLQNLYFALTNKELTTI